jgi:hypothetical protein
MAITQCHCNTLISTDIYHITSYADPVLLLVHPIYLASYTSYAVPVFIHTTSSGSPRLSSLLTSPPYLVFLAIVWPQLLALMWLMRSSLSLSLLCGILQYTHNERKDGRYHAIHIERWQPLSHNRSRT